MFTSLYGWKAKETSSKWKNTKLKLNAEILQCTWRLMQHVLPIFHQEIQDNLEGESHSIKKGTVGFLPSYPFNKATTHFTLSVFILDNHPYCSVTLNRFLSLLHVCPKAYLKRTLITSRVLHSWRLSSKNWQRAIIRQAWTSSMLLPALTASSSNTAGVPRKEKFE